MQGLNPLLELVPSVVLYEASTGTIRSLKNNRKIFPDEEQNAVIWIPSKKKLVKIKFDKLCYYLGHGSLPSKQEQILHKNLDDRDNRLSNLVVVPRDKYYELKEAILNIEQLLKIVPHKQDQYMFVVQYKLGKKTEKINCNDIIAAQEQERKLRFKFVKLITKYYNIDN